MRFLLIFLLIISSCSTYKNDRNIASGKDLGPQKVFKALSQKLFDEEVKKEHWEYIDEVKDLMKEEGHDPQTFQFEVDKDSYHYETVYADSETLTCQSSRVSRINNVVFRHSIGILFGKKRILTCIQK
jgi:hypothetical protein